MLYQFRDWESYRYDMWFLPGVGHLRGPDPRPLPPGGYVSYMGSAHTFGRFCNHPFPERLRRRHGLPGVDLSTSAVGPRYFMLKPALLDIANAGRVTVIQATSARSCGNSQFHNDKSGNNVFQAVGSSPDSPSIHETQIFPPLFAQGRVDEALQLAKEMKAKWVEEMRALLGALTTPKVLLWFSSRAPRYEPDRSSWQGICGEFPQLVDEEMIEEVRPLADTYVDVTSRAGLPIKFRNRFTGAPGRCFFGSSYRSSHGYYPSDPMHGAATDALEPVLGHYFTDEERTLARANPSAHARMIDIAERAAREPGDFDPFAPVMLFEALNGYHLSNGVKGRVVASGTLERHTARLTGALAAATPAEGPARLIVLGEETEASRPALDTLLARLPARGVVMVQDGNSAEATRTALVARLQADHGLKIVAFVDWAAVLAPAAGARELAGWLSATLREITIPQYRRITTEYGDKTYAFYESRARSDHDIDHAAYGKTRQPA